MINLLLHRRDMEHYSNFLIPDQNLLMLKLQGDTDSSEKYFNIINQITKQHGGTNIKSAVG